MLCLLVFGDQEAVFLEENKGNPMEPPSAAPPWDAQMLCLLIFGDQEAVFLEENRGNPMEPPSSLPLGSVTCFAC